MTMCCTMCFCLCSHDGLMMPDLLTRFASFDDQCGCSHCRIAVLTVDLAPGHPETNPTRESSQRLTLVRINFVKICGQYH